jgi:hypothetical protein
MPGWGTAVRPFGGRQTFSMKRLESHWEVEEVEETLHGEFHKVVLGLIDIGLS